MMQSQVWRFAHRHVLRVYEADGGKKAAVSVAHAIRVTTDEPVDRSGISKLHEFDEQAPK